MQSASLTKITIEAPARVHISLLAMDEPLYRLNGGLGFAINHNNIRVVARPQKTLKIVDRRSFPMAPEEVSALEACLLAALAEYSLLWAARVDVLRGAQPHSGFGCGTSLRLSCLEALFLLNEVTISEGDLVRLSLRGGTSGIGVKSYFRGGFVFDLGHRNFGQLHGSSRSNEERRMPPLELLRRDMPDWGIGVCVPSFESGVSGMAEVDFFKRTCPVHFEAASAAVYHSLLGVAAAVMESDYSTFCRAVRALQLTDWKRAEISIRSERFRRLMQDLSECTDGVGMSSLGPALYFFSHDVHRVAEVISSSEASCQILPVTMNNSGRVVTDG